MALSSLLLLLLAMVVPFHVSSTVTNVPFQSPNDKRSYKILTLSNALEVILISDSQTSTGAASMVVGVGSFENPENLLGLAHFCEHMLFLGSRKFPKEVEFFEYLSLHAGSTNAFTASEDTTYYFSVDKNYLYGALERWSQFFISPSFEANATDRELKAVISEHSKNLQNDDIRFDQLFKSISNNNSGTTTHPYFRFSTGSNETLVQIPLSYGLDLHKELLSFYSRFYSANVMKLAILGQESLDVLETWVNQLFTDIPNKNITIPNWGTPFGNEEFLKKIYVVPIKVEQTLNLVFPLSPQYRLFRHKPITYISSLIKHEAKGRLIYRLKIIQGWATALDCGIDEHSQFSVFAIVIKLTPDGLENVDNIIAMVFSYISLINRTGIEDWRYEELRTMASNEFAYLEKSEPSDFAVAVSQALKIYPEENVLNNQFFYDSWSNAVGDEIRGVLSKLTPENLRLFIYSPTFTPICKNTEHWYGTQYTVETIQTSLLEVWKSSFDSEQFGPLPERNMFIPNDLNLKKPTVVIDEPRKIIDVDLVVAWHQHDTKFNIPKANLFFLFETPVIFSSPSHLVSTSILLSLIKNFAFSETCYYASLAGLAFDLQILPPRGILVSVSGYNDNQISLVRFLLPLLLSQQRLNDSNLFHISKQDIREQLTGILYDLTIKIALQYLYSSITSPSWTVQQQLDVIDSITMQDIDNLLKQINEKLRIVVFGHGNLLKKEFSSMASEVLSLFSKSIPLSFSPSNNTTKLEDGSSYFISLQNITELVSNSATVTYFQVGGYNLMEDVVLKVLNGILFVKTFYQLRTVEQLGYIAQSSNFYMDGVFGYLFMVQSGTKDSVYLDNRIESFIQEIWKTELYNMNETVLSPYIEAVASDLSQPPLKLDKLSSEYWNEILLQDYIWNRKELLLSKLKKISKFHLVQFCETYFFNNTGRHRLSVQIVGNPHTAQTEPTFKQTQIVDVEAFKKAHNNFIPTLTPKDYSIDPAIYNQPSKPEGGNHQPLFVPPDDAGTGGFLSLSGMTLGMLVMGVIILIVIAGSLTMHYGKCCDGSNAGGGGGSSSRSSNGCCSAFGPKQFQEVEQDDDLSDDFLNDDITEHHDLLLPPNAAFEEGEGGGRRRRRSGGEGGGNEQQEKTDEIVPKHREYDI